jgi:twinkle protein
MRKKAVKPVYQAPEALPTNVLAWFEKRGISPETLKRNRIGYGVHFIPGAGKEVNAIQFPYLRGGEVVNIKYRDGEKHFCQAKDAEKIFYGLDDVAGMDIAIIVEGEMDKLALEEAGIRNVLSVPDGAPGKLKETASPDDKKFEYIGNSWPQLEHIKTFVLAVDSDEPGKVLEEELARRLGREKCLRVNWPTAGDAPCKDANEVLMTHGADVLRECIDLAAPYPIRNLVDIGADETDILTLYHEGYAKAFSTGWPCLDDYLKIRAGELSVVTGTPGSGKSEWIDALMVNLAENEGWKFAVCSFENPVATHRSKLIEKRMRLPFWPGVSMRMSEAELRQGAEWVREHFHFMQFADDAPTIDAILDTARGAVRRYGIKGLVIDPYNEIEHKRPAAMTETEYVSEMLGKIKRLAQNHDVHVWFVAHPGKLPRDRDGKRGIPGLYDISGSANWVNKADIGIVVHRDPAEKPPATEIHIRKVRFRVVGQLGTVKLSWDKKTGRYSDPADTQREYYNRRYQQ